MILLLLGEKAGMRADVKPISHGFTHENIPVRAATRNPWAVPAWRGR
jgi:hypothetical protein